jgi:hypothetical protein
LKNSETKLLHTTREETHIKGKRGVFRVGGESKPIECLMNGQTLPNGILPCAKVNTADDQWRLRRLPIFLNRAADTMIAN